MTGILVRLAMGLVIGFCLGMTGVGGGVLVLPALTLGLGMPPSTAVGTASLYSFLTKIYASYRHYRLKTIAFDTAFPFLIAALPANVAVALLVNHMVMSTREKAEAFTKFQSNLKLLIAAVIFMAGLMLVINLIGKARREAGTGGELAHAINRNRRVRLAVTLAIGALVGALIGSTAIGGGVVIIPLLIIVLGFTTTRTVGTSIFATVVLNLATTLVYSRGGSLDAGAAVLMAAGSMAGVYWGSKLSVKMPEKVLQGIVMGLILLSALLMALRQIEKPTAPVSSPQIGIGSEHKEK